MRAEILQGPKKLCGCDQSWKHMQLSNALKLLRRFRIDQGHQCFACPWFTRGLIEDYMHILVWMLGRRDGRELLSLMTILLEPVASSCKHDYLAQCKLITSTAKKAGYYGHRLWRYLCYWETAMGYQQPKELDDLLPDVEKWLCTPHKNGLGIGESEYLALMYKTMCSVLHQHWVMPEKTPSLDDWLRRGAWMRGKSGTGTIKTIQINGHSQRTRRHKGIDAVVYADEDIKREMLTVYPQTMVIMQKSEPAKVRPVAKTDNQLFRKMDFLSEVVEVGLTQSRLSPIFLSTSENEQLDLKIMQNVQRHINCPLDQGSFDNNQSVASILIVLVAMYDVCFSRASSDYKRVWRAMWDSLVHPKSKVVIGRRTLSWKNGLASGLRWTALIGTLLNICSALSCMYIVKLYKNPNAHYLDNIHQGDDIHLKATTVRALEDLISTMTENGYDINSLKTYVSRTRTEFLRRSYEPNTITGYLGRSLTSLRFRNPIKCDPISKPSRAYERVSFAMLMRGRGAVAESIAEYIFQDCQQLGIDRKTTANFCLTPNAVGGLGLFSPAEGVAGHLRQSSDGQWIATRTLITNNKLKVDLGAWRGRLNRIGGISAEAHTKFSEILAVSWGIAPNLLIEGAETEWIPKAKITPMAVEGGMSLPKSDKLWEDDLIPTLVRPIWKEDKVRNDEYIPFIKPEYRELISRLAKRVSHAVLGQYLLGTYTPPSPMIDGMGMKYGCRWKKQAEVLLLRALSARDMNEDKLARKMLWIELKGREELSSFSRGVRLAI